jgi:hypothetical protein
MTSVADGAPHDNAAHVILDWVEELKRRVPR